MGWKHQLASVWSNIWECLQISHQKKTEKLNGNSSIIPETATPMMEMVYFSYETTGLKGSYLMKSCEKATEMP